MHQSHVSHDAKVKIRELQQFYEDGLITTGERDHELMMVAKRNGLEPRMVEDIRRAAEHKLQHH